MNNQSDLESRVTLNSAGANNQPGATNSGLQPIQPIQNTAGPKVKTTTTVPWKPVVAILAVCLSVGVIYKSLGSIVINSSPTADSVTINGKQVSSNKKIWRFPGQKSKVVITKSGYITFEKEYKFGYSTNIVINHNLKAMPQAKILSSDVSSPIVIDKDIVGVKALNLKKDYILRIANADKKISQLNLESISNVKLFQLPTQQDFVLIEKSNEIGTLDFARQNVTSQTYKKYADNISAITLSPDGKNTFYLEYNSDTKQHYLVYDNITHTAPDRYFDEAQLKKLGISNPILKWSPNNKIVMSVEKQIVLINLLDRKADVISIDQEVTNAWFVPNSTTILVLTKDNRLMSFDTSAIANDSGEQANPPTKTSYNNVFKATYAYAADSSGDNLKIVDHGVTLRSGTVHITNESNLFAIDSQNRLISYNFISKQSTTYLLDQKINASDISSLLADTKNSLVYVLAGSTLYSQTLEKSEY